MVSSAQNACCAFLSVLTCGPVSACDATLFTGRVQNTNTHKKTERKPQAANTKNAGRARRGAARRRGTHASIVRISPRWRCWSSDISTRMDEIAEMTPDWTSTPIIIVKSVNHCSAAQYGSRRPVHVVTTSGGVPSSPKPSMRI